MLASHRYRYIFIKTRKTAGTSVEVYFEPYCLPYGMPSGEEFRSQSVSESGIVGFRGYPRPWPFRPKWYNHMPARKIRALVGHSIWNEYFKFTVVRNPFDKLVSAFFFFASSPGLMPRLALLRPRRLRSIVSAIAPVLGRDDGETIENFRAWVRHAKLPQDRQLYCIDGEESVDFFIRYEDLAAGIEAICGRVGLPFEPGRLPAFKSEFRNRRIPLKDFYDRATLQVVCRQYAWEIKRFDYDLH